MSGDWSSDVCSSDLYPADGATLDLPCGIPLTFRLPKEMDDVRASDQVRLLQILEPNEAHLRKAELLCMLEFDTNFDAMEKWEIINKAFAPEDIFVIDGFKRTFKYGPDNVMNCKCAKCGKDQQVSFRFSILEFFPTDTDSAAIRTRVFPSKASKADAKRAAANALSKTPMAPKTPPTGVGGASQRQSGVGVPSISDAEAAEVIPPKPPVTVRPNLNPQGSVGIPKVPANFAAKILEEARHEVQLEIEQESAPAAFRSIVNQK